ncbi:MAG: SIS domain-containing protein [Nitrosopumilus sp.]|nr:SIS domain-containing protein [Nitrosopumilus sp.]MDH5568606.1 SIS domain-containing protein [Nitrosopumilus sp.]
MLDLLTLQKFDSQKMYEVYDRWPEIAQESYNVSLEPVKFQGIDHMVFAGMGGSGSIGSIFSSILSKTNIHVSIVKGYILPKTVDSDTLVVTTSVSGNTDETLTILDSASRQDCKVISFSSGGEMEKFCMKKKIEFREIPKIHSPRGSFTRFLYSMLKVLNPVIPIPTNEISESIVEMKKLSSSINSENLTADNPALNLAEWISGIPLIYYPAGLQAAAIRFKNSLQENAKMHAIIEDVVESSHNGIVSWEQQSSVIPIMIEGADDYIKTKERWQILKKFFDGRNIEYKEIFSGEGNILTKLMRLVYLLDYASIYRSVLSGIDPTPVESINFVKNNL